jgi:hypothetical protein
VPATDGFKLIVQEISEAIVVGIVTVDIKEDVLSHVKYLVVEAVILLARKELGVLPMMKLFEASLIKAFTKFVSIFTV